MDNINIRFIEPKDIDQLVDLCATHPLFERFEYSKKGKSKQLLKELFDQNPKLYCLVLENKGRLLGYMSYMRQFSTWGASNYLYMDCLYLEESIRGNSFGEKMIRRLQKELNFLECKYIQWQTPSFNKRAIKFYERIGGISLDKKIFFLY